MVDKGWMDRLVDIVFGKWVSLYVKGIWKIEWRMKRKEIFGVG